MIRLERLALEDGPRLRAVRLRALAESPDAFASTLQEAVLLPAESWTQQLVKMRTFVAVADGVDVGMARYGRDDVHLDTAWLFSMWVGAAVRRRGIGGMLVDAIIDAAGSDGLTRLLLEVGDSNAPAIALYRSRGFRPTRETSTFPPPREHIREHRMELLLRQGGQEND